MLEDWRQSGLSRTDFAEQTGITLKTFDRWRSRLEGPQRRPSTSVAGLASVELVGGGSADSPGQMTIIPGLQPRVVLSADIDADVLRRVLRACTC